MKTEHGNIGVQPTPSWDPFETVSLSVCSPGWSFSTDITPDEADQLAAELRRWAQIVRDDS